MTDGYYVIQRKPKPWVNHWEALTERYETMEAARAALAEKKPASEYRLARAYVQVRYAPIVEK